jgi:hypothetical protein
LEKASRFELAVWAWRPEERRSHEQTWAKRQAVYNEIGSKTAAIDARIRTIIEKEAASKGREGGEAPSSVVTGPLTVVVGTCFSRMLLGLV